ncbi:hypothetical protein AGABI1DRAFT_111101 [Agaricus bisporus var. burnettii JB137-S8]|uniref:mRNA splicing factor n=2 Tax=Agaricus bisporus var. burnettii TaxID=192524 RepID=K5X3S2_AGABU|nr:hypothetical protein AGABI2DRAFT_190318 [Agaricus bisporus var. bisporus H97]XP_007326490.1 uncharacterized protein AGABI1DRAFT_111101 [Agaricus bisporus var. burnettii JB137-S8]EKM82486.1 hypothetical protein AGABI1DRAFT_111101 [Agaricus bisporus var. burnettii JB137-S8]EKV49877.1 hypothetical protein AGABI2DRAFT_190318 [Agaricus bisporus var. bisporus H97]KAF7778548.1 hypothetical protein Agabi119p4_2893 [Agaricus bisporus var. burnettii]
MSLAAASEARKTRLTALRKRKTGEATDDSAEPAFKPRNFDPETRTIKKHTRDDDVEMQDTVEKDVAELAEEIIQEDKARQAQELDVFNIAPKRPNWDLKREMDKKLSKLERRTQEAIHTLIRQRLAAQKGESDDIVGAMKAEEQQQQDLSDEED